MYSQTQKLGSKYHDMLNELWLRKDLFSAHWWTIVILNAVLLILFFLLIERYRILLISFAFMIAYSIVSITDEVGSYFDYWRYPHQLVVFTHHFNAVDFAAVPVIMSLTYQYFSKWKNYLIAMSVMSAIISFIGVPIFVAVGLYKLEHWNYFYSFLVMVLLFIVMKWVVDFVGNKAEKYRH